jgi:hypothetical protein
MRRAVTQHKCTGADTNKTSCCQRLAPAWRIQPDPEYRTRENLEERLVHFALNAKTVFTPRFFACGTFSTFLYGNGSHSNHVTVTRHGAYTHVPYASVLSRDCVRDAIPLPIVSPASSESSSVSPLCTVLSLKNRHYKGQLLSHAQLRTFCRRATLPLGKPKAGRWLVFSNRKQLAFLPGAPKKRAHAHVIVSLHPIRPTFPL